jgi:hypothetical protein
MFTLLQRALITSAAAVGYNSSIGKLTGLKDWNAANAAYNFQNIVTNLINVLNNSIVPICAAIFVTGAVLFIASFGKDNIKTTGKTMMIGAVLGLVLVLFARAIINLAIIFLYDV